MGAGRIPDVLSGVMGNSFYMAKFNSEKDVHLFEDYVSRKTAPEAERKSSGSMFNKKTGTSGENICDTHIDGA